jgi:hypothetical protein
MPLLFSNGEQLFRSWSSRSALYLPVYVMPTSTAMTDAGCDMVLRSGKGRDNCGVQA